jgi:hypothetical protein
MNTTVRQCLGLSAAVWLASAAAVAAQTATVEWKMPPTIRAVDRRDILAVARMVGITEPIAAAVPLQSACTLVQVKSKPVLNGNQVLSKTVAVRQFAGAGCNSPRSDTRYERQGNWFAFNPKTEERWRIRDGDWNIDVFLQPGIAYEEAALIVQAIHQRRLLDRRPDSRSPVPPINPDAILSVEHSQDAQSPSGAFEVRTGQPDAPPRGGSGYVLHVVVRNGAVELHGLSCWMS